MPSPQVPASGRRRRRPAAASAPPAPPSLDSAAIAASLDNQPGAPLHRQVESGLRHLIRSGAARPGSILPGEHELAVRLGVSRHTVRHALGVLAAEGLLRRQRGRGGGTRVADPPPAPPLTERSLDRFYAFAWEVRARGADHRSFVLDRASLAAGPDLAARLGLPVGAPVERLVRLRTGDGEPLVLETAVLPADLAAGLDADAVEHGSIYDTLERLHGLRVVRARETIRPVVLDDPEAALLGVPAGSPAFAVERQTFAERGPIEWQQSLVRGDRYLYSVDLARPLSPSGEGR